MCRKSNYLLYVFTGCDPLVKTKLIASHCLALYGCVLWRLDCKLSHLKLLLTTFFGRFGGCQDAATLEFSIMLPTLTAFTIKCHTGSQTFARAFKSDSPLIQTVCQWASNRTFTAPGFNNLCKKNFVKVYKVDDHICAEFIWDIQLGRLTFESADILNTVLYSVVTDCVVKV